jgi:hypothetical protein
VSKCHEDLEVQGILLLLETIFGVFTSKWCSLLHSWLHLIPSRFMLKDESVFWQSEYILLFRASFPFQQG